MSLVDGTNISNISDLIFSLDALNSKSYPGSGSTWYDVSGNNNHFTLYNSPTYKPVGGIAYTTSAVYASVPASIQFNGTTSQLNRANASAFQFGTGDFTVEFWIYCGVAWTSQVNPGIAGQKLTDTAAGWVIYRNTGNNNMNIRIGNTSLDASDYPATAYPATTTWEHWAVTRASGTLQWYRNGSTASVVYSSTQNINDASGTFYIGYTQTWGGYFNGFLSNIRISKSALYTGTGTFTVPTTTLTTTTSTVLLLNTYYDNVYRDVSTSSFTLSVNATSSSTMAPIAPVITGISTTTSVDNDAYFKFNGIDQYARSTNAINFNNYSAVTLEIGYRASTSTVQVLYETTGTSGSTVTGGISLVMNTDSTSTSANKYLSTWWGDGHRLFSFTPSTTTAFNSVINQYVNGVDSTGRQSYVNGNISSWWTITNTLATSSATTTAGGISFANTWTYLASRGGTSNFLNGDIAYVRAWGKKLTQTDISRNTDAQKARRSTSFTGETITNSLYQAGGVAYVTPGTYYWVAPQGFTTVSVVVIGPGAMNAGGGGGLTWANGVSVTPGSTYQIVVGAGGYTGSAPTYYSGFNGTAVVAYGGTSGGGGGGTGANAVAGATNYGGGNGGGWGGGAGGYTGNGGVGYGNGNSTTPGADGSGGGGGGGGNGAFPNNAGGGGTGIYGAGSNGVYPGGGGSGGSSSSAGGINSISGLYGGGGAASSSGKGGGGAVRIIWGGGRAFPNTATAVTGEITI